MKNIILFFIICFIITSCNKDDLTWNLKRISPKDAKLEVSEIIYSNNCEDLTGLTLNAWGPDFAGAQHLWVLSNDGVTGNCIEAQTNGGSSASYMDSATIVINTIIDSDCVLRFFMKYSYYEMSNNGMSTDGPGKIEINNKSLNAAIISEEYDENSDYNQSENWKKGWHQIQTEVIRADNNSIKIKFPREVSIDNIELWVPIY